MGVSVAFHAALAAGLCAYLAHAPSGVVQAELDLSSVELSFAEQEDAAAPEVPTTPPASEAPPPDVPVLPPEPVAPEDPIPTPPDPEAMRIPEPDPEPPPPMDLPEPPPDARAPAEERPAEKAPDEPPPENAAQPAAEPVPPAPAAAPKQARVDAPPALRKTLRPDYPRGARMRGEEGDVQLEIAVDARGGVTSVAVVSACPYPELNDAAVKAARKARFTPARQGRRAVPCTARITLTFRLRD
jgi:protein TonB